MYFTVICPPVALKAYKGHFFPRLLVQAVRAPGFKTKGWATDQVKSIQGLLPIVHTEIGSKL